MKEDKGAIKIKSNDSPPKEFFRVENDGKVFWLKDGKMVRAKVDSELVQAFAFVVTEMSGYPSDKLVKKIVKDYHKKNDHTT